MEFIGCCTETGGYTGRCFQEHVSHSKDSEEVYEAVGTNPEPCTRYHAWNILTTTWLIVIESFLCDVYCLLGFHYIIM